MLYRDNNKEKKEKSRMIWFSAHADKVFNRWKVTMLKLSVYNTSSLSYKLEKYR